MSFYKDYRSVRTLQQSLVCLGNFDGLHLGHQLAMQQATRLATEKGLRSILFTFSPHPKKVLLKGEKKPSLLFTEKEKEEFLQKFDFDQFLFQKFDQEFSQIRPEDFLNKVLIQTLKAKHILVGSNFRYGFEAKGGVKDFENHPSINVDLIDFVRDADQSIISSSAIRELVKDGELKKANQFLGYPFFVTGRVIKGDQRGRSLGFPTANLQTDKECLPKRGVYFGVLEDLQTGHFYVSLINVGKRPTFGNLPHQIEAHLVQFSDDLYDRSVRLYFLEACRDEQKFETADALKAQIEDDLQKGKSLFAGMNNLSSDFEMQGSVYDLQRPSLNKFQVFENKSNFFISSSK